MIWSTAPKGDRGAVAHRMGADSHGRPVQPVCGRSTEGLWLRIDVEWERVPEARRCPDCA